MPRPASSCAPAARPPGRHRGRPRRAWWSALQAAIAEAGGLDDVAALARSAAQQHGMVVLDADGRVIRPALLWNDTRSAEPRRPHRRVRRRDPRRAHRPRARGIVHDHEAPLAARRRARQRGAGRRRRAAARLADLAAARLRPARASPRAVRVLDELVTDRSDASGTGYWDPATGGYDRELLVAALGHDAILPRVLGPGRVGQRRGRAPGRPGAGDNAGAALGLGRRPGRRRGLDRHERHRLRRERAAHDRPDRARSPASPMRRAGSCRWSPPSTPRACSTPSPVCSESTTPS